MPVNTHKEHKTIMHLPTYRQLLPLAVAVLALGGCASNGDPRDPLEPMNRAIYRFNDVVDKAITKPVAQGYRAVLPTPVRNSVTNFFSNIDDLLVMVNNLLQFKLNAAGSDFARIAFNTTFGIGGLFDVATGWGLPKHNEDFGQTLGFWGVGDGPYLVLPLLGPSNLRDSTGLLATLYTDPLWHVDNVATRNTLVGVRFVDRRARLLDAERVLDEAALDPYAFLRDSYLQHRRSLIHDGNPPREKLEDDDAPPVKKTEADDSGGQTLVITSDTAAGVMAAVPAPEAAAPAADTAQTGLPLLLSWLFRGGDAPGWQE